MEFERLLPHSQEPAISMVLCNISYPARFHDEQLLSPRPTSKLEDNPLSAVRDRMFYVFAATLRIWRPSPPSATRGRTMPWWWQGPT